jgi:hypothetical protein
MVGRFCGVCVMYLYLNVHILSFLERVYVACDGLRVQTILCLTVLDMTKMFFGKLPKRNIA